MPVEIQDSEPEPVKAKVVHTSTPSANDRKRVTKPKELTRAMRVWILAQRKHHHGSNQDRFEWSDLEEILL